MRLFDVLTNFPFTTSETVCDYYLQTWYIRVASRSAERLKAEDLMKLGNIRKVSKLDKIKIWLIFAKKPQKIAVKPFP